MMNYYSCQIIIVEVTCPRSNILPFSRASVGHIFFEAWSRFTLCCKNDWATVSQGQPCDIHITKTNARPTRAPLNNIDDAQTR